MQIASLESRCLEDEEESITRQINQQSATAETEQIEKDPQWWDMEVFIISLNVQASSQPELKLKTFSERMQEPFHTKAYLLSCYWICI